MEGYGVELYSMRAKDMETVRGWRNDREIMKYMFHQKPITAKEQREWFCRIDRQESYYFMIEYGDRQIGQVSLRKLDREKGSAESGVLVYGENQGKKLGQKAMLVMLDFAFYGLGLKLVIALVRADNARARKFHAALGYKETESCDGAVACNLTESDYRANKEKILGGGNEYRRV